MIEYLTIKNVTIIEYLEVNFYEGLNILTGETGAGKSIIIDSISFILGGKANKEFIRRGCNTGLVECLIYVKDDKTVSSLVDMGVKIGEDNRILISRSISLNSKNTLKINGKPTTIAILKEISSLMVDIHGQHEIQYLLNSSKHMELLDKFCDIEVEKIKNELSNTIKAYKVNVKTINSILNENSEENISSLKHEIEEISSAKLIHGEEEELQERKKLLKSYETLVLDTDSTVELLYGNSESVGAIDKILSAKSLITNISSLDKSKQPLVEILETVAIQLDDVVRNLRKSSLDYNPQELSDIELRLDYIYTLKRKYGNSIESILNYQKKLINKLDNILENIKVLENLKEERKELQKNIIDKCNAISYLRKKAGKNLETKIEKVLVELGMEKIKFKINIDKKNKFNTNGNDKIEFLISTNIGEPLKSLSKIASGGEMSRVMLALKVVLSKTDNISTFIFDEIDTGVSGRTAQKVAEKLAIIAKNKQILCITHLPQIASMADKHFLIEKSFFNEKTITDITILNKDCIIKEIARLIGGAKITDTTNIAAKEMKEMADNLKSGYL